MRHTHTAEQWLPYPIETVFDFFANPENLPRLMPAWQKARIDSATFAAPPPRPAIISRESVSSPEPSEQRVPRSSSSPQPASTPLIAAGQGTRMTISFRPFPFSPIRVPWDAEITEFVWNDHFCDVQHRGPFAYWKHCHRLESVTREGTTGTLLHDHVDYELPLGILGDLANTIFARAQMNSIFRFRQARTSELLPIFAAASL